MLTLGAALTLAFQLIGPVVDPTRSLLCLTVPSHVVSKRLHVVACLTTNAANPTEVSVLGYELTKAGTPVCTFTASGNPAECLPIEGCGTVSQVCLP